MGKSTDASLRLEVVKAFQCEGLSYRDLSARYHLSYNTTRTICRSYESKGESSLLSDYSNCGRRVSSEAEKSYRLVRLVKSLHPSWGVPYTTTRIRLKYPELLLQADRHYQRRLRADRAGAVLPRSVLPANLERDAPRVPHDEWQIDAKERIDLPNGEQVCYLNITDRVSHALLEAKVFPPRADFTSAHNRYLDLDAEPIPKVGDA